MTEHIYERIGNATTSPDSDTESDYLIPTLNRFGMMNENETDMNEYASDGDYSSESDWEALLEEGTNMTTGLGMRELERRVRATRVEEGIAQAGNLLANSSWGAAAKETETKPETVTEDDKPEIIKKPRTMSKKSNKRAKHLLRKLTKQSDRKNAEKAPSRDPFAKSDPKCNREIEQAACSVVKEPKFGPKTADTEKIKADRQKWKDKRSALITEVRANTKEKAERRDNAKKKKAVVEKKVEEKPVEAVVEKKPVIVEEKPVIVEEKPVEEEKVKVTVSKKGQKARERRAAQQRATQWFYEKREEVVAEKREEIHEAVKHQTELGHKRKEALQTFADHKSEDVTTKLAAGKSLKWTRPCNHALRGGVEWRAPGSIKFRCPNARAGKPCGFAHNDTELLEGWREALCRFDLGEDQCKHRDRCTHRHTIRDSTDNIFRCETEEEFQQRTGLLPGVLRVQKVRKLSSGSAGPARTLPSSRASTPAMRVSSKVSFANVAKKPRFTVSSVVSQRASRTARLQAFYRESSRSGGALNDFFWPSNTQQKISQLEKMDTLALRLQALFHGQRARAEYAERLSRFKEEEMRKAANAAVATQQKPVEKKIVEEKIVEEKIVIEKKPIGFNWAPGAKTEAKTEAPVPTESAPTLTGFMNEEFRNTKTRDEILSQLEELGVEDVRDLTDLDESDIAEMGLKKISQKKMIRIIGQVREWFS